MSKNIAVFIDRDGVINKEVGYLHKIKDFIFIDGVFETCKHFIKKGYKIIIITNQSGIGRGYYTNNDFHKVNNWMLEQFKNHGIIAKTFFCPHSPADNCDCRKPKIAMLLKAQKLYNLDLQNSWIIGDKESDITTGINAKISNTILVESGHKINKQNSKAKYILKSIKECNKII